MKSEYYQKLKRERPWELHYYWGKDRCRTRKTNAHFEHYAGRGITFALTIRQIKLLWIRDHAQNLLQPSLDRINEKLGYTLFNCRFIEQADNFLRTKGIEVGEENKALEAVNA